jgi:hypothetical protein
MVFENIDFLLREKQNMDQAEMVRKIRDMHYEQTKGMSKSEYLRYIKENGGKALEQIKKKWLRRRVSPHSIRSRSADP